VLALRDKVGMHFSTHRSGTHTAVSDRRGWRRRWGSLNVFEVLRCLRVSLRHCESSQIQLNSTISKNTQKGSSWIFFRSSRALTCKLVGCLALAGSAWPQGSNGTLLYRAPGDEGRRLFLPQSRFSPPTGACDPWHAFLQFWTIHGWP
jgi:hypothetical protein